MWVLSQQGCQVTGEHVSHEMQHFSGVATGNVLQGESKLTRVDGCVVTLVLRWLWLDADRLALQRLGSDGACGWPWWDGYSTMLQRVP